jgi:hypothetical protein
MSQSIEDNADVIRRGAAHKPVPEGNMRLSSYREPR